LRSAFTSGGDTKDVVISKEIGGLEDEDIAFLFCTLMQGCSILQASRQGSSIGYFSTLVVTYTILSSPLDSLQKLIN
jgi:hypothetical protein